MCLTADIDDQAHSINMPASTSQTTIAQIMQTATQDKREQPWKKTLNAIVANGTSTTSEERVKTGGTCDVLTNFFAS